MKTLKILLVVAFVIFSGFARDSQTNGTKEGVGVPIKVWVTIFPDHSTGDIACTPEAFGVSLARYGYNQGHQTHGGKLIPELSRWEITDCIIANMQSISQVNAVHTLANGDSYSFTCVMIIDLVTKNVAINCTVTGGTGRYEGATGEITVQGGYSGNSIPCYGEGFISFLK